MAEPTDKKELKTDKTKKLADPVAATIDVATQQMIRRAQELGVETIFDRAVNMKPCNIGIQGTCCKNCAMGPCRLPLPKGGIEGEDERKGLCGATANTIAARNFARMVAAGCAAHSDHGRTVAEVFMSVANKETQDYKIKDYNKLLAIAPHFGVDVKVEVDGQKVDRDLDEIALEVAQKALAEWGKPEGELHYLKRAPQPLYERWKKLGVLPRNIDREVVEIMHRTHMGVDQDYKNILKQCTRAALADGWGGSMIATDLQDVMFGTPFPLQSEANLGIMKEDHVNIIIHGHEPVLSEMIVAAAPLKGRQRHSAGWNLLHRQRNFAAPRRAAGRHLPAAGTGDRNRRLRRHGGRRPVCFPESGQCGQMLSHQADHNPSDCQDGAGKCDPHRVR